MVSANLTFLHGLLICIPFTIFAAGSFIWKPRLWLHSLPPDIIAKAFPKTESEKKLTKYLLLPAVLLILPGLSLISVFYIQAMYDVNFTFVGMLVHLYGMWVIVHVWDFLLIDCVAIMLINPSHPPIAGTENAQGWKDYHFHFRALIRAILMSALFVVPCSAVLTLVFDL